MIKLLKALLAILLVLVALVLLHPLWIGPVVRTAVTSLAPKFLGVAARLDGFSLNAYTGRLTLDGFALDNPPGCGEEKFVTIGHLCLDVDPFSVASDPIVVEEITLTDFYLSLVTDRSKAYNFATIAETAGGGKKAEKAGDTPEPKAAPDASAKKTDEKPAPKVIIDLLQINNVLVQWERVSLPLPSFRMTGLGRGTNGATFEAAWREVETQFIAQLGPLAQGLQGSLDSAQDALRSGQKALNDLSATLKNAEVTGSGAKVLESGTRLIGDTTKTGTKVLDDGVKALDEGAKALKSLFGK